ncbi:MAG: YHYH protein [Sediminibacterium sp.]|nr:YHYH protein [Sediminibacterium sp.]
MKKLSTILTLLLLLMIGCNSSQKSATSFSNKSGIKSSLDYLGAYTIDDAQYGTKTVVSIVGNKRIMTTNGLPNHSTGAFPNEGNPNTITAQRLTYTFPLVPVFTGKARWAREWGVAVNGIKFEPETAEAFVCATGERYRIEAFQTLVNLGLDFNNAHVQPTGAYHYHGIPKALIDILYSNTDLVLVGFANDGFPIYYSKSGKYKPSFQLSNKVRTGDFCSYKNRKENINKDLKNSSPDGTFVSDWEYVKGLGDLDECNGKEINGQYMYFVTDTYPYAGRCLMGEYIEQRPMGPPPFGPRPPEPPPFRQ